MGEELKEMGKDFSDKNLYMQKDFKYLYACQICEPLIFISSNPNKSIQPFLSDFIICAIPTITFEEKRIRETLVNYAKDNNFEIQISNVESVVLEWVEIDGQKKPSLRAKYTYQNTNISPLSNRRALPTYPLFEKSGAKTFKEKLAFFFMYSSNF